MAGINLSQTTEKKKISGARFMDQGFIVLIVFFVLVLLVWGGVRYYMYAVTKETESLQASIDNYGQELHGEKVNRVTDISERLSRIEENNTKAIDIPKLMNQLERLTVPEVSITKYEYDQVGKMVHVSGTTNNFRFVAQQIISFRSESPLENIQVEKIGNIDEGKIPFTLKASLEK